MYQPREEGRADPWAHRHPYEVLGVPSDMKPGNTQRQVQGRPGPAVSADVEGPNAPGPLHPYLIGHGDRAHVEMKKSNELIQKLPAAGIRELHTTPQSLQRETTVLVAFL